MCTVKSKYLACYDQHAGVLSMYTSVLFLFKIYNPDGWLFTIWIFGLYFVSKNNFDFLPAVVLTLYSIGGRGLYVPCCGFYPSKI